uniref:Uncharacterized protein n=1 Tax=Arundo donax TaxID=35708 RepID=A0A0A8YC87_ARUDO
MRRGSISSPEMPSSRVQQKKAHILLAASTQQQKRNLKKKKNTAFSSRRSVNRAPIQSTRGKHQTFLSKNQQACSQILRIQPRNKIR